jgi:hypothetical protein
MTGKVLVVDEEMVLSGDNVLDSVTVTTNGGLYLAAGTTLVTHSISLEGDSVFDAVGSVVRVLNGDTDRIASFRGHCSWLNITQGSVVLIEGADGAAGLEQSTGASAELYVAASEGILIRDSEVRLIAGDGHSPEEPYTNGDLDGDASAGGDVLLALLVEPLGGPLEIVDSLLLSDAGAGGDAPSGGRATRSDGGRGGGYSEGGNVTGRVGSGGKGETYLAADAISIDGSIIKTIAGNGGDGGNATDPAMGATGGGGGGGYSGGHGADEAALLAGDGGRVSGTVGAGGSVLSTITADVLSTQGSRLVLEAGDGGDAGKGGDCVVQGGNGGGGYSGGGGGSYPWAHGGNGGNVTGSVGAGGDASIKIILQDLLGISDSTLTVTAGNGGDAGDGGDADLGQDIAGMGGAGGGGYSAGGGGALGGSGAIMAGTRGGLGASVEDDVGSGGNAYIEVSTADAVVDASVVEAQGGHGGTGGFAGISSPSTEVPGDWETGGGGGSYSSGGGGGSGGIGFTSGEGGNSGPVLGHVGDGGDAHLTFTCPSPAIDKNSYLDVDAGFGGYCWRSSAQGDPGGEGSGRATASGIEYISIPMSRPLLLEPINGSRERTVPVFSWSTPYWSPAHGDVLAFQFEMDDDPAFGSPDYSAQVVTDQTMPDFLPNLTTYWRVHALYSTPRYVPGPWSEIFSYTLVNEPPVVLKVPPHSVRVEQVLMVNLTPYISDPDDDLKDLDIDTNHFAYKGTVRLNLTFRFHDLVAEQLVNFTVTDGYNRVQGSFIISVYKEKHAPSITGIGTLRPPVVVELEEGEERVYDIHVHDVDSDNFTFYLLNRWEGIDVAENDTLHFHPGHGDVGSFKSTLVVEDEAGLKGTLLIKIEVANVEDPPGIPLILSPGNNSAMEEGDLISIRARVTDPDIEFGQVLGVVIISNVTGVLHTTTTTDIVEFVTADIPVGEHLISVVVFDGKYSRTESVHLTVRGPIEPPPVSEPPEEEDFDLVSILISLVLFGLGFMGGSFHRRTTRRK